jgi:hypothetical protein
MAYYLYQCAECYTTLYGDSLPRGASYTSVVNGDVCSGCQAEKERSNEDDD